MRKNRRLLIKKIIIAFFILVILLGGLVATFEIIYAGKIYPGVGVGNFNLGGKKPQEVVSLLQNLTSPLISEGLIFVYADREITIPSHTISPGDPDLSREIFSYDLEKTAKEAFRIGRGGKSWSNSKEKIKTLLKGQRISLTYQLNKQELEKILKENFKDLENPAQDAKVSISQNFDLRVWPETLGQVFDWKEALEMTKQSLENLSFEPIPLHLITDYPWIKREETVKAVLKTQELLKIPSLTFRYQDSSWPVKREVFKDWLEFYKSGAFLTSHEVSIRFNRELLSQYLASLAQEIDIEPKDARFKIKNDRVVEFQASREGLKLNIEESLERINEQVIKEGKKEIELLGQKIKPKISTASLNDLGIKELIGVGRSNFAGSPKNRRHNIRVGAESLNGLLIKPNEEFSLIKALGEITGKTGYLPEMVIKGNKTIPEYGGGLCQIGTTMFRVALATGLPIRERQPHSYRVGWYEPAGTDATIYDPHPDLRFMNDTPAHILIQTKIEADELIFEFWGSSDGRQVEQTKPKIYNLVSPGPSKIIETEDLAVGEKKCLERAHTGADTEFTRIITYPGGEIKKEVFKSHYKPWQEVCLVGKKVEEEPEKKETQ